MPDSLRKLAMVVHGALKHKVFRSGPEEKATRGGGLNQALGLYMEDRREEPSDLKAVLLCPKYPSVKHSFPLPDLAF